MPVPTPAAPAVTESVPVAAPDVPKPTPLKTYSGDFSDRVKETHASTATVLAAEQDAGPVLVQSSAQESPRGTILYIIAGVILLIAGSIGAYIAYTRSGGTSAPIVSAPSVSAPIFVDDREQVSGTGPDLMRTIEQSVGRPLATGAVRLLSLENAATTGSVFSALRVPAPDILLRNVNAQGSMAGIVNVGGAQSPFFILSVISYSNTFSGMLSWEPLLPRDLGTLFPRYQVSAPAPTVFSTTTMATTTTATTTTTAPKTVAKTATSTPAAPVTVPVFYDDAVSNHDVRIYRDAAGQSILLYGYWNQTTLVIARDPAAFAEILQRLATSRTQQ